MRSYLGTILIAAALVSACATSPTGRRQFILVSESQAIAASREAYLTQMTELNQAGKLVTDPVIVRRVEGITSKLVAQAVKVRPATAGWEWSVEVIDDPETGTPLVVPAARRARTGAARPKKAAETEKGAKAAKTEKLAKVGVTGAS